MPHHNKHQHKEIGWRLKSEKENSPVEDPWHIWHKPDKTSGTRGVDANQWQDQQHPTLCPLGSVLVEEPHHAEPKLLLSHWKWEQF